MAVGLEKTLKALAETGNEAAVEQLLSALDSPKPEISEGALRALLTRRNQAACAQLLRRWHTISDDWKAIIAEQPNRISRAVRDAIVGADEQLFRNGCDAVLHFREYDLIPALINAAEDESNSRAGLAAETLLRLAQLLYDELSASTDDAQRRDPQLKRRHAVADLEASVARFAKHQRREMLEAFLLLTGRDNATLKKILENPRERAYLAVVDVLSHSTHPGVVRLLLGYLDDPRVPLAAINLISRRSDSEFVVHLLKKIGFEPSSPAATNLKRMKTVPWLRDDLSLVDRLDDTGQHAAIQIAMASGMNRLEVYQAIEHVMRYGKVGGRRAASQALDEFGGAAANQLVQEGLLDEDPQVQANCVVQLRRRGIPGAITRLLEFVESPHEAVRRAAQQCLDEFNVDRFLGGYDMMEDDVRRSTGELVRKVDPSAPAAVAQELDSQARTRRLRAIGAAAALGVVEQLQERIIDLLRDEDHFVRVEAARALAQCNTIEARQALRQALLDASLAVQDAAEQSLLTLGNDHAPHLSVPNDPWNSASGVVADE